MHEELATMAVIVTCPPKGRLERVDEDDEVIPSFTPVCKELIAVLNTVKEMRKEQAYHSLYALQRRQMS